MSSLRPGTRLGPYEIVSPIGAGGMGEVFRARDTRLDRSVAIKILPEEYAQDAQLKIRLAREAKTISQLNHPHICSLFDIGHDNGTDYLVMEYIEGESLADRLMKGPLPTADVLRYGTEIADALDKAHRKGIVHRDLKPGNIMITKSGAKLLDFGLAKSPAAAAVEGSATQQKPLTSEGTIVGTLQYMAPEQIEGQEADARTDIFAFGAVLYEMATGKRAFGGNSKTTLIAAIVAGEPKPMTQVQPLTPAGLERAVRRCLSKDRDERWQTAADLKWELLRIQEESATSRDRRTTSRSARLAWSVAAAALVGAAILVALILRRDNRAPVIRTDVALPPGWSFSMNYGLGPPALSPDGRHMAFAATDVATGRMMLWIRDFSTTDTAPVAGTEGAGFAFWSPDSKAIAFFAGGYLKRIDLGGGAARVVCPASYGRGGSWSQSNEIIFSASGNGPINRVSADGGVPRSITELDSALREVSHRWPYFLPDGKHFLYLARRPWTSDEVGDSIYLARVDKPGRRLLFDASSQVVYTEPGYLLYLRDRTLMAHRFNLRTFELEGDPRSVVRDPLPYHPAGFGLFTCSRNGVLAFGKGGLPSKLELLHRGGGTETILGEADFASPRFSTDEQQIVYAIPDPATGNQDIWMYDRGRHVSRRVTFHPRDDMNGLLAPDGHTLFFSSNRNGFPNLYRKAIEDSKDELIYTATLAAFVSSISRDTSTLLFRQLAAGTINDIYFLDLKTMKATPFVTSAFSEIHPEFSRSGRWVAYSSNESGRYEVYVSRFPDNGARVQISTEGGTQPTWRGDEKELFYVGEGDRIMSVPLDLSKGVVKPGTPVRVAEAVLRLSRNEEREYDVSGDGRLFLINAVPPDKRSLPITVVFNWLSEFERK